MRDKVLAHPIILSGIISILFWMITGGSTASLNKIGLSNKASMYICIGAFAVLIAGFIVIAVRKKATVRTACVFIMAGGAVTRMWYALYALTTNVYQHDFGNWDYHPGNAVHENYIHYLMTNLHLPDFDIRGYGQYYHPPLHHTISAIVMKIDSVLFPSREVDGSCLKALSLFYSLVIMILIYKIMKHFGIDGMALVAATALASFYPSLIICSCQINNDPLANMLVIAGFYNALKWYRDRRYITIIYTALAIGCAMMTKLSAGLVAFPVGFIFLAAFIRSKGTRKNVFTQLLAFAAVVFPLGLWFPIRNLICWGIPPTYIFTLGSIPGQDVSGYSVMQRLFGSTDVTRSVPFTVFGEENKDFNIFTILFKSSLFDDLDHHDKPFWSLIAGIMMILGIVIVVIFAAGLVKAVIKCFKDKDTGIAAVIILLVTELASIIVFAFKYPLICSVNFRYVFPTVICFTLFAALCFKKSENEWVRLIQKMMGVVIAGFSVLSVVFFMTEWMAW